jgi:hypothetical protein
MHAAGSARARRNPFDYRSASLYCLECFLHQNQEGQAFVTSTLNQPPNANLQHATDTPLAAGAQVEWTTMLSSWKRKLSKAIFSSAQMPLELREWLFTWDCLKAKQRRCVCTSAGHNFLVTKVWLICLHTKAPCFFFFLI